MYSKLTKMLIAANGRKISSKTDFLCFFGGEAKQVIFLAPDEHTKLKFGH
jgi:hypothetical protein